MFSFIKGLFGIKPLKIPKGKTTPDNLRTSDTVPVAANVESFYTTDLENYRYRNPDEALLYLSKYDPDVSNAMIALIANVNTEVSFVARKVDGRIDKAATKKLIKIINTWDKYNLTKSGWDNKFSLDALINSFVKYAFIRGGVAFEVELDKSRMPVNIWLIDPLNVKFLHPSPNVFVPAIKDSKGDYIKLDIPTFFYEVLIPEADSPYASSTIYSVLESIFFSLEVVRDLRRIVKKFGYQKYKAKVLIDVMVKNAPASVRMDSRKLEEYVKSKFLEVQNTLATTRPEDALVFSDFVDVDILDTKAEAKLDFRPIIEILDQKISSSLKTLPTILGRTIGKSGASKEEIVLYAKIIKMYQKHTALALSKLFTLMLRLNGSQSWADVVFKPVDLRSETEVENHKTMRHKRLVEAVQLGWLNDYEACFQLYGRLPEQESGIFGKYLELNTKQGSGDFPVTGVGSDSPYNSEPAVQERRNDNEDIVEQGGEPSENKEVTGT